MRPTLVLINKVDSLPVLPSFKMTPSEAVKAIMRLTAEKDLGQETNNPFILVQRLKDSKIEVTLEVLNEVLAGTHLPPLSREDFDMLTSIDPITVSLPLSQEERLTLLGAVKGPHTDSPRRGENGNLYLYTTSY